MKLTIGVYEDSTDTVIKFNGVELQRYPERLSFYALSVFTVIQTELQPLKG